LFVSYLLISDCAGDSSDTTVEPEVDPNEDDVPKVEEAAKPKEGKNETRRATVYKAQEDVQPGQVTVAPEAMAAMPQEGQNVTRRAVPYKTHEDLQQDQRTVEQVANAKKRTRRSTRSKVAAAAQKGQKGEDKFSPPLINSNCLVLILMLNY
jgi:hypothetical protein